MKKETKPIKVKLDVYLTIHKVVEVETDKYYKFDGEINDGEYLPPKIEFDEEEIGTYFFEQNTLPNDLAYLVERGKANKRDLEDASGWITYEALFKIIKTK